MGIIYWLGVLIVTIANYKPDPFRNKWADLTVAFVIGLLWPALVVLTAIVTIIGFIRRKS